MSVVDDIRSRLDIVDVVSGYVALQKAGRNFKAPCPFHTERTPSFVVNPERQSWHCFGACSTGGDAFSFVMRQQNVEFSDALRILAQKAGVDLSPANKRESDRRGRLHNINSLAAAFYQDALKSPEGAAAMRYLNGRGVSADAIAAFQLGYSPDQWDGLRTYLSNMGADAEDAVASGLIYRNDDTGRTWDFFRGRLMFPIHDRQGNVSGFGGRQISEPAPDAQGYNPKYINTAATPVFDKRNTLYGLHLARAAIRDASAGIVVEGYMDVIAAHQHGYRNVVASMGTALTESQVAQLRALASKFVLALDPDVAGQEATLRSLEASWKVIGEQASRGASGILQQRDPVTLNIAALPDGRDPDELIRHDPREWERLTQNAPPLMSYLIPAIASRFDIATGQGKSRVVETVFPLIAATADVYEQQRHMQSLADALGITLEALKAGLPRRRESPRRRSDVRRREEQRGEERPQVSASALAGNREDILEDYILSLLLTRPQLRESVGDLSPEYFRKSADREVFTRWLGCAATDDLEQALEEPLRAHMRSLTQADALPADSVESERALAQCIRRLKQRHLKELQEALLATADASTPPSREIAAEIASLNAGIKTTETR